MTERDRETLDRRRFLALTAAAALAHGPANRFTPVETQPIESTSPWPDARLRRKKLQAE